MSARRAKRERKEARSYTLREFRRISDGYIKNLINGAILRGEELLAKPLAAWESPEFFVMLYQEPSGFPRLSINRKETAREGYWRDGITWDEIQAIKRLIGYGDLWAVEVYPAEGSVVNVSNMRHIFLFEEAPPFAWNSGRRSVKELVDEEKERLAGEDRKVFEEQVNAACEREGTDANGLVKLGYTKVVLEGKTTLVKRETLL